MKTEARMAYRNGTKPTASKAPKGRFNSYIPAFRLSLEPAGPFSEP